MCLSLIRSPTCFDCWRDLHQGKLQEY